MKFKNLKIINRISFSTKKSNSMKSKIKNNSYFIFYQKIPFSQEVNHLKQTSLKIHGFLLKFPFLD